MQAACRMRYGIAPETSQEVIKEAIIEIPAQEPAPEPKPEIRHYYAPKEKKPVLKWEKPIQRVPILPEDEPKKFERPKAEYDNHKSHFGVYAELQKEWIKRSG